MFPSRMILLQQPSAQPGADYSQFIFLGAILLVFYFFIIRPQQKKQKEARKFLSELKKGDEVVTIGGVIGKVANIEGDIVYLEVDRSVKLKLNKTAIASSAPKTA